MTFPTDDEYGEFLRRAMRAEADSVVPSPEGLDIIRHRIEEKNARGLRGLFWWRVGASVAGAALVAGTVVMLVPDLRTQVIHSTVSNTGDDSRLPPDTSSVNRPPNTHTGPPAVTGPPSRGEASSVETPRSSPTVAQPSPSPSPSDPCATPETPAQVVEPSASGSPACPTTTTPTPPVGPSSGPTPSRTPTGCSRGQCETPTPHPSTTPTPAASPSASDVVTPDPPAESPSP
ncbi:hypothetical protein [Microtetraspora niveoalba]|uniref:hypothetical protein n=1 Tax=Microtetraspora niveoalba TaxID=46175 RepID=UPI00082983D9|nr:hypothetical protein [Microtetraspora niveoalba]